MSKSKYTHIIWDWNGTLKNDAEICVDIMNDLLQKRKIPALTLESYREYFDFPVRDYYQKIGLDFTREPFEALATEYMAGYDERSEQCGLHPHAATILQQFAEKERAQYILSAREQAPLEKSLAFYDLKKYFRSVIGLSDHYANGKIENGKKLITQMNTHAHNIVMIGDTTHDFEVAQAIGVDCVLFAGGHQSIERLQACGTPVVENLNDLLTIIH
jgi:phosphoglycolate phosphatase